MSVEEGSSTTNRYIEVAIVMVKLVLVLLLIAPVLFFSLLARPIGIADESARMPHFARNQGELEAVVHEALAANVEAVNHRAWWQRIFDPPPKEQRPLHRAMGRAKVQEVEVYKGDEGVKVNLMTGFQEGIFGSKHFGYSWVSGGGALEIFEDGYIVKSSRKELGNGWFLYEYDYDPF